MRFRPKKAQRFTLLHTFLSHGLGKSTPKTMHCLCEENLTTENSCDLQRIRLGSPRYLLPAVRLGHLSLGPGNLSARTQAATFSEQMSRAHTSTSRRRLPAQDSPPPTPISICVVSRESGWSRQQIRQRHLPSGGPEKAIARVRGRIRAIKNNVWKSFESYKN